MSRWALPTSLPCAPEDLDEYEGALLARFESSPHLQMLASTPLLAAMLCALNLDRSKQLPRNRMGLYAAALELLLERRDAERGIAAEVVLEPEQKVRVLQDLAGQLAAWGRSELSRATALKRVGEKIRTMPRMDASAEAVLDHLLQRSGVDPGAGSGTDRLRALGPCRSISRRSRRPTTRTWSR